MHDLNDFQSGTGGSGLGWTERRDNCAMQKGLSGQSCRAECASGGQSSSEAPAGTVLRSSAPANSTLAYQPCEGPRNAGLRAMLSTILAASLIAIALPCVSSAQDRPGLTPPGSAGPAWNRLVRLNDGRTFITDGAMMIDVALVKPSQMPTTVIGPERTKTFEDHLASQSQEEFGLAQLTPHDGSRAYLAPSGVALGAPYLDYLRRILPPTQIRLRTKGEREPVVILLAGEPVGLVMPVVR